jgi:hypothetical protein
MGVYSFSLLKPTNQRTTLTGLLDIIPALKKSIAEALESVENSLKEEHV